MAENAYGYLIKKGFLSLFWNIAGLLIGILISLQLDHPQFNLTS